VVSTQSQKVLIGLFFFFFFFLLVNIRFINFATKSVINKNNNNKDLFIFEFMQYKF
jgi:hypothetical protein